MNYKSGTELLYSILSTYPIGYKITSEVLFNEAKELDPNITFGKISGFLNKSGIKGVTKVVGKRGRKYLYEIISLDPWKFKPSSIGSKKGRTVHRGEQPELPHIVDVNPAEYIRNHLTDINVEDSMNINQHIGIKDVNEITSINLFPKTSRDSLAEKLLLLAQEVEVLENKTLADYSTDDLIAEIKRRIK